MPKGETTTLREHNPPAPLWPRILKRNASPTELLQAQVQQVGQAFEADGHTYEIAEVKIDTIHRLIAIGKLVKISNIEEK